MQLRQEREYYTYADYCEWNDGNRWELIDGEAYLMAAPGVNHQRLLGRIFRKFADYLDDKECEVFIAPFDIRLNPDKADDTVVQPDLVVICDPEKLIDGKACKGSPDLVIEILSPSTSKHDLTVKFNKYRQAGVKELWYVYPSPDIQITKVYKWSNGEYLAYAYSSEDEITVGILPELTIDMKDIFKDGV